MTTKVSPDMLEESAEIVGQVPISAVVDYYGTTEPDSGTYFKFPRGQAISRTTYATLFGLIGTTHGAGDGSTTFNLPDERGRINVGKDNMGGTPANRVTSAGSGVDGSTLGATGGSQLLQEHNHTTTVNDSGHTHSVSSRQNDSPNTYIAGGDGSITGSQTTGSATTGITVDVDNTGSGSSQNMPPVIVSNRLMRVL